MDASTRRWLDAEQTLNDRLVSPNYLPIDDRSNTVWPAYRPEHRPVWPQPVVWLPRSSARVYGEVEAEYRNAFDLDWPAERVPLLLHPQAPAAHRALARRHGRGVLHDVRATPTASYRSVLAWRRGRAPVMLKLSIGATIARRRRRLRERQVASAVIMSAVFETIPESHRATLGFDWFADSSGLADTASQHGWLLRRFPRRVGDGPGRALLPAFSLVSARGSRPPLLVEIISRSGADAATFVVEQLLRQYVEVAAYLLFVQGIQIEGHCQNVLLEVDAGDTLTGRLALRDLSDTSVSIPHRLARRKPLPAFPPGALPAGAPFPFASVATDYACNFGRPTLFRAFDTVERYGLWGFAWTINTALTRWFPTYDAAAVEDRYLALWQNAAMRYLAVRPLFRETPKGVATDEALAYFLDHVDWPSLGATSDHALPAGTEPFRITRRARPRTGPVYQRLECPWGDIYLYRGHPSFFRPAF